MNDNLVFEVDGIYYYPTVEGYSVVALAQKRWFHCRMKMLYENIPTSDLMEIFKVEDGKINLFRDYWAFVCDDNDCGLAKQFRTSRRIILAERPAHDRSETLKRAIRAALLAAGVVSMVIMASILSGCGPIQKMQGLVSPSFSQSFDPGPYPDDYKQLALRYLGGFLYDPSSARNIAIGRPYVKSYYRGLLNGGGSNSYWVVCVGLYAKNRFGAYVGRKRMELWVSHDQVVEAWSDSDCDINPELPTNEKGITT